MTTYKQSSLFATQINAFTSGEPKTLGAIEIIIGGFIVIVSSIVYKLHLYIQREIIILIVNGGTLALCGILLVHTGRRPSKRLVLVNTLLQLLTAGFDIVAFGLAARQLPFRAKSYNQIDYEYFVNGIVGTLMAFLGVACITGLVVVLYGFYTLSVSTYKDPSAIGTNAEPRQPGPGPQNRPIIQGN